MPLPKEIITATLATKEGENAYKIVEILTDAGYDTWWVGGGIRDMLLGRIPKDIDIATEALPDEVLKLLTNTVGSPGKDLGSVIVRLKGLNFEVTTFREDDEASDGRHPEVVVFGKRAQDAKRRDITINAIYSNPISREIYDPFHGEDDLTERLIRFIGEPGVRIRHDALRLLRVVRFRALLDGQYHPDTYRAVQENARFVEGLSGARILWEMEKMLLGPHPDRAFEDLWETGMMTFISPELHACKGMAQPKEYHHEGDVWDHTMLLLKSFLPEHAIDVRIAGLFHDVGKADTFSLQERIRFDEHAPVSAKTASEVLTRLQCPSRRKDKVHWLITHHMMMGFFADMTVERKTHWYHHPWFHELLQIFWLDIAGTDPQDYALYGEILQDYHRFLDDHPRPAKQLLSGEEIMKILGLAPGEKVGQVIAALHDAQVRGEVTKKSEAREFIRGRATYGVPPASPPFP
ncbi:MAG: CCA tRNA nucleotidyltransferase [Candidatus Peribacteraceae bacterium]|nr:CCA tRNA nucleotidyltransferase [Candidatus Peribacteraceae bacterium]